MIKIMERNERTKWQVGAEANVERGHRSIKFPQINEQEKEVMITDIKLSLFSNS